MEITEFSQDMNIISALSDAPTLTAAQLKAKFDEGGLKIKDYINNLLIPALSQSLTEQENSLAAELDGMRESLPEVENSLESQSESNALSAKMGGELYALTKNNKEQLTALQQLALALEQSLSQKQGVISCGQGTPSGGNNGDIYLMY